MLESGSLQSTVGVSNSPSLSPCLQGFLVLFLLLFKSSQIGQIHIFFLMGSSRKLPDRKIVVFLRVSALELKPVLPPLGSSRH